MIAKLIIHPDLSARVGEIEKILASQELKKDHVDVLWMEEEKLGVEQAKKIRQHLSLKPYSAQGRAVVVLNFQVMTPDAQNSLLKTLEEPPIEAIILLAADSDKDILLTILSRIQSVILGSEVTPESSESIDSGQDRMTNLNPEIEKLLNSTIEQRFEFIEKLEDKEAFLQSLLEYFHHKLSNHSNYLEFTKELMKAEEWRDANGNIRAILEYLMLKMP